MNRSFKGFVALVLLFSLLVAPFQAAYADDTEPPTLTSSNPADEATGINLMSATLDFVLTFSEPVSVRNELGYFQESGMIQNNPNCINVIRRVGGEPTSVYTEFTVNGNVVTLSPYNVNSWSPTNSDVTITIYIRADSVRDASDNPVTLTSVSFSGNDTYPPGILGYEPPTSAQRIDSDAPVKVLFTELMKAGSGYDDITVTQEDTAQQVPIEKSIVGKEMIISPQSGVWGDGLAHSFLLSVPAGSVADLAGNALVHAGNARFNTRDPQPPSDVVVHFDSQGGSTVSDSMILYNTTVLEPPEPTRTGHTFSGWFEEPECITLWDFDGNVVTQDITLYAKWTQNTYTVSFNSREGSTCEDIVVTYGEDYGSLPVPTRAGHSFTGWYAQPTGGEPVSADTVVSTADNHTLYAGWTINTYTVSFNSQGGTVVAPMAVDYGATFTAPVSPTRSGYVFQGWFKESACTTAWDFANDTVTEDIRLYAKWISTTPTGVAAASASYNSVKVSWTAVPGAAGYQVYRATSSTGAYALAGTATGTSFTNTGLSTGITYYYRVRSYKGTVYSAYSSVVSAKPVLAAPTSPKAAAATYNSIKVTWAAVSGATKYEVYRATSSIGSYSLLTSTSYLYYTNTSVSTGTTYYYKVRAYRLVGSAKVYSSFSSVLSAKTTLAAPASPKASLLSYNSIKVTWGSVAGASKYELYRSTSSGGTYSLLAATSYTYYTNSSVNTGTTYYYKVRAYRLVGGRKVYSVFSSIVNAKPMLTAPSSVKASRLSSTSMKITWGAVAGVTKYEIWQSKTDGVPGVYTYSLLATTSSAYFTTSSITPGMYYQFKVRAYRLIGSTKVYSSFSGVAIGPVYIRSSSALPYKLVTTNPDPDSYALYVKCSGGDPGEMNSVLINSSKAENGVTWIGVIRDLNSLASISFPQYPGLRIQVIQKSTGKLLFYYYVE